MAHYPKISVVTVCFNAEKEIEETILSVVDQTYDNIEYIIIDGVSTDGTVDIIKKYAEGGSEYGKHNHNITYWKSEPDKGIYDAMNKGIDLATGDYINFMNAGDCFYTNNVLFKLYNNHINTDIIYGNVVNKTNFGNYGIKPKPLGSFKYTLPFSHQSVFVKSELLKSNKFNILYKSSADFDQLLKLYKENYKFHYVDLNIAIVDLRKGMSKDNYLRISMYEQGRILGIDKTFCFKLNCLKTIIKININTLIKKLLPKKILLYMMKIYKKKSLIEV